MTPERLLGADAIQLAVDGPVGASRLNSPSVPLQSGSGRLYAAVDLGTNSCRMLIAHP